MNELESILGYEPMREPGLIRRLDDNYFKKVEAIEFAVQYDDGKDPRGIVKADIVLVGVSRTSKTPLSMYLANKLYKVANVPLVPEVPVPKEVYKKIIDASSVSWRIPKNSTPFAKNASAPSGLIPLQNTPM